VEPAVIWQQGDYIDHSEANRGTDEKTTTRYSFPTRDSYRAEGSSRLQRVAADTLYKPIWRVTDFVEKKPGKRVIFIKVAVTYSTGDITSHRDRGADSLHMPSLP